MSAEQKTDPLVPSSIPSRLLLLLYRGLSAFFCSPRVHIPSGTLVLSNYKYKKSNKYKLSNKLLLILEPIRS